MISFDEKLPLSGVLVSIWRARGLINYGTGFALAHQIIITCTHNIYLANYREYCDKIYFIQFPCEGQFNLLKCRVYESMEFDFIRAKALDPLKSFKHTTK